MSSVPIETIRALREILAMQLYETYRSLGQSSWGCQTKSVKDSYRREADLIMDGRNED